MKKSGKIVISLCALFLIGGVAACKHGHHPGGFDEFDPAAATHRIASRLDLTEIPAQRPGGDGSHGDHAPGIGAPEACCRRP